MRIHHFSLVVVSSLLLAADPSWQTKPIASWTEDDAHQVLSDSPWAKSVTPKIIKSSSSNQTRPNPGMAQVGGVGIGVPGVGGMGGMGRRGGTRSQTADSNDTSNTNLTPPTLTVRWESSLPVQAAELKARNVNSPSMDDDHYAIAVYGIPSRLIKMDSSALDNQLKDEASIKREGKKDLKPSSVQVIPRDEDNVVVYYFPRSKEITRQDKQIEFAAQILSLQFSISFNVTDMTYQTKLEL
jgi:hypothetical protein